MSILKKVIAEKCTKMMAVGLDGKPFHKNTSEFEAMLEVWHEAITHAGYTDESAPVIAQAWNELIRTSERWFYPKSLLAVARIDSDLKSQLALPNLSDDQRIENLKRIQLMAAKVFK